MTRLTFRELEASDIRDGDLIVGTTTRYNPERTTFMVERDVFDDGIPCDPGLYVDAKGDPWKLAENGYWYDKGYVNNSSNRDMAYIQSRAPFRRLAVELVTAENVLVDAFESGDLTAEQVGNLYRKYGVPISENGFAK